MSLSLCGFDCAHILCSLSLLFLCVLDLYTPAYKNLNTALLRISLHEYHIISDGKPRQLHINKSFFYPKMKSDKLFNNKKFFTTSYGEKSRCYDQSSTILPQSLNDHNIIPMISHHYKTCFFFYIY